MKISRFLTTAVLAALAVAAPLRAADGPVRHGPLAGYIRCLGVVHLTEDQKTQIRGIFETAKPNLEALGQKLKTDAAALKALTEATTPEPCAIGTALLKVKADGTAIKDALKTVGTNVASVLTPEQKARLEGCLAAHHALNLSAEPEEDDTE